MGEITGQPVFFVREEGRGEKKKEQRLNIRAILTIPSFIRAISLFPTFLKHGMSFGVISATVLLLNHRKRKKERERITVVPILLLRRDQIS